MHTHSYNDNEARNEDELETALKQVIEKERESARPFREAADDFSVTFSKQNRQKNSTTIIYQLEQKERETQQNIEQTERLLREAQKALEELDGQTTALNARKKQADERINQLTHDIDRAEKENMQHREAHAKAVQRLTAMDFAEAEASVQKHLALDTDIDPALETALSELNILLAVYHDHASRRLAQVRAFAQAAAAGEVPQESLACFCWGQVFKTLFHDPSTANDGLLRQHNIYGFADRDCAKSGLGAIDGPEGMERAWSEVENKFSDVKKLRDEVLKQYEESSKVILTHLPLMDKFKKRANQIDEAQEELRRYNSLVSEACSIADGVHGCEDPLGNNNNNNNEESKKRFLANKALFDQVVEWVEKADKDSQEIARTGELKAQKQRHIDSLRETKEKLVQNSTHINELLDKQKISGTNSSLVVQAQAKNLVADTLRLVDDVESSINGLVSITQDMARLRSVRRVAINDLGLIGSLRQSIDSVHMTIENSEDINDAAVEAVIAGLRNLCKELSHLSKLCSQKLEFIFGATSEDTFDDLRVDADSDDDDDEDNEDCDDYSDENEDEGPDEKEKAELAESNDRARTKSTHAINVLNRVKAKLEGKDASLTLPLSLTSSGEVMSVDEQVNSVIAMAKNPENLSKMYEGWTAWI